MGAKYQPIFESRLLALNPDFTTNALGFTAAEFTELLSFANVQLLVKLLSLMEQMF
jgi:hypothetical protein